MELASGNKIRIDIGSSTTIWTVSKVDNKLVKYFDEGNHYNQIPLAQVEQLVLSGQAIVEKNAATRNNNAQP